MRNAAGVLRGTGLVLLGAFAVSLGLAAGCNDDAPDRFLATQDAGDEASIAGDADRDDALVAVDPTLGGPCNDDGQCDDQIACTFDSCDKAISRCRNTPDDAQCADAFYCNGAERCVLRQGCAPGAVVTCQDDSPCTIDKCIEASRTCEHALRDSDGDGDPDGHCTTNGDCDDTDPTVSTKRQEICNNLKDDNCNGSIDEEPCVVPANDTCATASAIAAPGIYQVSTFAAKQDYPTTCATSVTGAQDVVLAITLPAGADKDVLVTASTALGNDVALTLEKTCGNSNSEVQCTHFAGARRARAIARSTPAGTIVYAVITTAIEANVDVKVEFLPATAHPANETCASPQAIALDTATTVSLIDATQDLPTECVGTAGDLTYQFTLPETRDVRIYAMTTLGDQQPIVSLRSPSCTAETPASQCNPGLSAPLFLRALPKGDYVVGVSSTGQIDASLLVKTSAATTPAADEDCTTAPVLTPNTTTLVDLTNHQHAIPNDCLTGGVNAARKLTLTEASDVLLVSRVALVETGEVSLQDATCGPIDPALCQLGTAPAKVSKRNVPPGEYRVVVGDQLSESAKLIALVRKTIPPVTVTSDTCTDAQVIPATGGYFTGDTSGKTADYATSCDAPNQPQGTAKDQVLKLTLPAAKRVVFDMSGTEYTSLIDVRTGEPCPGVAVTNACNPSFNAGRAFLDVNLNAGTYWVIIDGYSGATGKWALDVRVLDQDPPP